MSIAMSKFLSLACCLCPIGVFTGVWIAVVGWDPPDAVPACLWSLVISLALTWLLKNERIVTAARSLFVGASIGLAIAFVLVGPTIASFGVKDSLDKLKNDDPGIYSFVTNSTAINSTLHYHSRRGFVIAIPIGLVAGVAMGGAWILTTRMRSSSPAIMEEAKRGGHEPDEN